MKITLVTMGNTNSFQMKAGSTVDDLKTKAEDYFAEKSDGKVKVALDQFTLKGKPVKGADVMSDGDVYLGMEKSQKVKLG